MPQEFLSTNQSITIMKPFRQFSRTRRVDRLPRMEGKPAVESIVRKNRMLSFRAVKQYVDEWYVNERWGMYKLNPPINPKRKSVSQLESPI